jgi:L-lactate permease
MRRPLLVGTLAAAVIALVASAAVAFGAVGGPSSAPTMTRGGTSLGDRGLLSGPPARGAESSRDCGKWTFALPLDLR